jgi:hypothetical protein
MKAEQKYWQKMTQDRHPVPLKTHLNRIDRGRKIKADRQERERLYQENRRAEELAEFERVGSWKAALLSDEELASFKAFVESSKYRLGKSSFKSYSRVAKEVFNDSDLKSMVSHLMKEHFPIIYEQARQYRVSKRNRLTSKSGYRGREIPFKMFEMVEQPDGSLLEVEIRSRTDNPFVEPEVDYEKLGPKKRMKPAFWYQSHRGNSLGRRKRRAFIEYVKSNSHRKGEGKLSIKTYVQMAAELGCSPVSCAEWMRSSFPAIFYQKRWLHSSYASRSKRIKARLDLNLAMVQAHTHITWEDGHPSKY